MDTLRTELARLLEIPVSDLTDDTVLTELSTWDSLTKVSLIAYVVGDTKQDIDALVLEHVKTFRDVQNVLGTALLRT